MAIFATYLATYGFPGFVSVNLATMDAAAALRSMPSNMTDETRVLARLDGRMTNAPLSVALASLGLESALPVRTFFSWQGKRNYEGRWWSSTVRSHVGFESLLERDFLLSADHDRDVVGVASQPFAFLWPRGTEGSRGHVPDFFVRLRDGTGRVVDVKPAGRVRSAERQFSLTREACAAAGWDYQVFTGLAEPRASNLRWLAGYRQDRFAPSGIAASVLVDSFTPETSLAAGVRRAAKALGTDESIVRAQVLHLLFTGVLDVDLDAALTQDTPVSPGVAPKACAAWNASSREAAS
ncbi:TnsA-like heteromeric transposase endonuclease subunit [Arthrobacter sp. MMS18-M83]|uniref:TnsA-like heteromeric transposase endonuclease subunit n=1 Tax=Arthrobacter sp. MMS18-M83 TaxID=2996261 RepID=UPI00227A3F1D|nr:TnsA-like heteromeric transposase endonuclease subunit [Arthrobacter sp. MMS18-M83]WAH96983.1 TnsA-like heteromeric transposase endonuclease subunit [Arthrobacter sp. MMS18-M83]